MNALHLLRGVLPMLVLWPAIAWGQRALIADFVPGPTNYSSYYSRPTGDGDVVGFRFTADEDRTLSHLGVLRDLADGVQDAPHEVGLWDEAGQLLTQVTVLPSGMVVGGFIYEAIAPVDLVAGNRYTLGASYFELDLDSYNSVPASLTLRGISNTVAAYPTEPLLGFTYPGSETAGNRARLGPNALFVVPEPSTCTLVCWMGLYAIRRGRRH